MKKIFFWIVLFFSICKLCIALSEWYSLQIINKENDVLKYIQYSITYSSENAWKEKNAVSVETNFERGDRDIEFADYQISYQAYDKRDDILGSVVEKKNGDEPISLEIRVSDNSCLYSDNLQKTSFLLIDVQSDNLCTWISYVDGKVLNEEIDDNTKKRLEMVCEKMIDCIENFEKIATQIYQQLYQEKNKELFYNIICYSLWIILWSFGRIIIKNKKRWICFIQSNH